MVMILHQFFLGFLLFGVLVAADPLVASAAEGRVPLVTIRFNQQDVRYEQDLFSALEKAVKAKPGVKFEIVSRAPVTGDAAVDRYWQQVAGSNTRRVIQALVAMGVPTERIAVTGKAVAGLPFDETQVFVL